MPRRNPDSPNGSTDPGIRVRGLVLEIGDADLPAAAATNLAPTIVRRVLGDEWSVEPLTGSLTFRASSIGSGREFRVRPTSRRTLAVPEAWEASRSLLADRGVSSAEPSFELAGLEPPPNTRRRWLTQNEIASVDRRAGRNSTRRPPADWSLRAIHLDRALARLGAAGHDHPGAGVRVGHPDTGYTRHAEIWPPLEPRHLLLADGYDILDDNPDALDRLDVVRSWFPGHGTSTASVLLGRGLASEIGHHIRGVAPECDVIALRVARSVVHLGFEAVARALDHAVAVGCHVVSMSLGGPYGPAFLERAVRRAVDAGVIVVAAAGDVWPWVVHPARLDEVVAVAASNVHEQPWALSAAGAGVDLAAPGEDIFVAMSTGANTMDARSSTSFATAYVAGAAVLWLQLHGRDNLIRRFGLRGIPLVFHELLATQGVSTPADWDGARFGAGVLDLDALLAASLPDAPPARGFRLSPDARQLHRGATERLQSFVPDVPESVVRSRLARMVGVSGSVVPAALAPYYDEIEFHFATSPLWRDAFGRRGAQAPLDRARLEAEVLRAKSSVDSFVVLADATHVSPSLRGAIANIHGSRTRRRSKDD